MAAKKSPKKAAAAAASPAPKAAAGDKLHSAVYQSGKLYDPAKPGHQELFKKAVASGKMSPEALQNMADQGVVKGFGTSAMKAKKSDDDGDEAADMGASADIGGGVQGSDEPTDDDE
ncbi:MAG: hypothetical protein H0W72_05145 [Planctomycetes bacterium]|nr:hypothetical protein [Planctomycetota bacterium]